MRSTRTISTAAIAAGLLLAAISASSAQISQRTYASAFDTYRPWQSDTAVTDWRATNKDVQNRGMQRGEMQQHHHSHQHQHSSGTTKPAEQHQPREPRK